MTPTRPSFAALALGAVVLVCLGGTAGTDSKFIDGVYAANGRDAFDILAVHPYCAP